VRNCIKTEWVEKFRDQLLAEAYALFMTAEPFSPSRDDEARLFAPMQESRLVETAVISELWNILTRPALPLGSASLVNGLTEFVTMSQLTVALGVDAAKSGPALEGQIRAWLDHEGWDYRKKQINGIRAHGYARPANWPPADVDDPMQAAAPAEAETGTSADAEPLSPAAQFLQDADDAPF
jgi:hypothetical protein